MSDGDLEFIDERTQKKENANSHLVLRELTILVEAKHRSEFYRKRRAESKDCRESISLQTLQMA
jgi:hypothetical protein